MIKGLALVALFLGAVPFLLGLLYTRFVKEDADNVLLHMAAGYVVMFAVFEIVALPLSFLRQTLSLLTAVYIGILLALAAVSLILNWRRLPKIALGTFYAARKFTICIWAQVILFAAQAAVYLRYQYSNSDDAFFVAAATTSLSTNTIFAYNPYTGAEYVNLPARYVLSPFYAFTAVISKVTGIHPAILSHVVFSIVFLGFAYAVYALLARALFSNDMEKTGYFLVLASALNLFSAFSERVSGMFLLLRLWQGKAVLAGVLLPMILYLAIRIAFLEGTKADYLLLAGAMWACCMVSSMGIILGAVMLGILGILLAFRKKSVRLLLYAAACCLPNLLCAGMYLIIR